MFIYISIHSTFLSVNQVTEGKWDKFLFGIQKQGIGVIE